MSETSAYRINEPGVIAEAIDGEVVILNFDRGTYYSLNASGMVVWQGIQAGLPRAALVQRLRDSFPDAGDAVTDHVSQLLAALQDEELIVPASAGPAAGVFEAPSDQGAYHEPRLEKFTDLQDLLVLDPIHDAGAKGWPNPA